MLPYLLPYVEQGNLYQSMMQGVPADYLGATAVYSPWWANGSTWTAAQTRVPTFLCPSDNAYANTVGTITSAHTFSAPGAVDEDLSFFPIGGGGDNLGRTNYAGVAGYAGAVSPSSAGVFTNRSGVSLARLILQRYFSWRQLHKLSSVAMLRRRTTHDTPTSGGLGSGLRRLPASLRGLLRSGPDARTPAYVLPGPALRPAPKERRTHRPGGGNGRPHPAGVPQGPRLGSTRLRDRLHHRVAEDLAAVPADDLGTVGLLDETSVVKKGKKTPGVQRQYCGAVGKQENCTVSVHLGVARGGYKALLDADLFLPQSWSKDRPRCQEAGIPDDVVYQPKWRLGLEQIYRAMGNGIVLDWLTFDEGYGCRPAFLAELDVLAELRWLGEVPKSFRCLTARPRGKKPRKGWTGKRADRLRATARPFGIRRGGA